MNEKLLTIHGANCGCNYCGPAGDVQPVSDQEPAPAQSDPKPGAQEEAEGLAPPPCLYCKDARKVGLFWVCERCGDLRVADDLLAQAHEEGRREMREEASRLVGNHFAVNVDYRERLQEDIRALGTKGEGG